MILYINACVRGDSRTRKLAEAALEAMDGPVTEVRLWEQTFPVRDEALLNRWQSLLDAGAFDDAMFDLARQFAAADEIVIAAPYWDLSFPATLKEYLEVVNALGITFKYTPEGTPVGLCRAKRLLYITTAGGVFVPDAYGFGYVKALAESFYGIPEVVQVAATGLDIVGADVEGIMKKAIAEAREAGGRR